MAEPSDRGTARLVDVHHVAQLTGFSAPTGPMRISCMPSPLAGPGPHEESRRRGRR